MNLSLGQLTVEHLTAADELRALVGWNQRVSDWQRLLSLEPQGCFVAELAGRLVGTVTTTCYGKLLAWIGMMLVQPDFRRQGVGQALLQHGVAYLRQRAIQCVKLDATPQGQPLYERIGFMLEWKLARWEHPGSPALARIASNRIRQIEEEDWPAILELDAQVFGVARGSLLRALAEGSYSALVYQENDSLLGFGMVRGGARADYLGPIVVGAAIGPELVAALLSARADRPIFWDIPEANESAVSLARQLGFCPVRPLARMFLGANSVPSDPLGQFAIADPATG
jgi:ribosomal protein S18 acetylase RimI-like enzyme